MKNDGGPALPAMVKIGEVARSEGGLSVRDWFAGQAIGGVIRQCAADIGVYGFLGTVDKTAEQYFAEKAGAIADAMIAERDKR